MRFDRITGYGISIALAAIAASCVGTEEIEPRFDMEGKKVAVIPFEDREVRIYPSEDALDLFRAIARDIRLNNLDDIQLIRTKVLERFFESRNIEGMSAQEIGRRLGVHYVITGAIWRFDTEGAIIGLKSGLFQGMVKVHDVEKDDVVFEEELDVAYPRVPTVGMRPGQIRRGLLKRSSNHIARLFYHYEKEEEGWDLK